MTKDDFHFIVPEVCAKAKTVQELKEVLCQFVVSGYNVGNELLLRTQEYMDYINTPNVMWNEFLPEPGIRGNNDGGIFYEYQILDLFKLLGSISSSNTKADTLHAYIRNNNNYSYELITKFVYLTLSSVFTFNATVKIFDGKARVQTGSLDLKFVLENLEQIGFDNMSKPKEKIQKILYLWENSSEQVKTLIEMVIAREFKIGMNEKTFFDILSQYSVDKRILLVPYQRCEKEEKISRINFPCMGQLKADGKFQNILIDHIRKLGLTLNRSGMRSNFGIINSINQFNNETGYLDRVWPGVRPALTGEALVKKPGEIIAGKSALDIKVYERETGNGLLTSYGNRHTTFSSLFQEVTKVIGTPKVLKKLEKLIAQLLEWKYVEDNTVFQLWNMFSMDNWLKLNTGFNCKQAFEYCADFIYNYNLWIASKGLDTNLVLIHNEIFEDMDSIYDLYYRVLESGMEGLVIKNLLANIEHGVCTTGIIKLKEFKDCELKIIGYLPGTGKYTGGIGSYDMSSEDGRLLVNVAGLTDKQRGFERADPNNSAKGLKLIDGFNPNDGINKIYTVKYNKKSTDKTGKPSLSLPSIMGERTDVTRASFFHEIK